MVEENFLTDAIERKAFYFFFADPSFEMRNLIAFPQQHLKM